MRITADAHEVEPDTLCPFDRKVLLTPAGADGDLECDRRTTAKHQDQPPRLPMMLS